MCTLYASLLFTISSLSSVKKSVKHLSPILYKIMKCTVWIKVAESTNHKKRARALGLEKNVGREARLQRWASGFAHRKPRSQIGGGVSLQPAIEKVHKSCHSAREPRIYDLWAGSSSLFFSKLAKLGWLDLPSPAFFPLRKSQAGESWFENQPFSTQFFLSSQITGT